MRQERHEAEESMKLARAMRLEMGMKMKTIYEAEEWDGAV